jgi:hypothetical protein
MQARIRVIFRRRVGVLVKKVMIVAGAFRVALAGMQLVHGVTEACPEQSGRARS